MKCALCKAHMPIRSNQAVAEELHRLTSHILGDVAASCPNDGCENYAKAVGEPGRYARFGRTRFGTTRWRCNSCGKTFTEGGNPLLRQRKTHKNRDVFMMLMNKVPIRRIVEMTGLDPKTIYGKIAFIHRQCLAFSGARELRLLQGMPLPKMYIAVDRQAHNVNWSSRRDWRNVVLNAIASVDLESGYVFGFHLNFDPSMDPQKVEREAAAAGDLEVYEPFRRHARVWLARDYAAAVANSAKVRSKRLAGGGRMTQADRLAMEIAETYEDAQSRPDVEASEAKNSDVALPSHGMQVRETYTMHGHFQLLAAMLQGAEKVRVYMDQDSGIRAAFLAAFVDRIKERTADGWYVSVLKETTIHDKEAAVKLARDRLKAEARCAQAWTKTICLLN